MAIKVTVGEQKTQNELPFPKFMKSSNGRIVFMISYGKGFLLNRVSNNDIPKYSELWFMGDFADYNEPITLQNETT